MDHAPGLISSTMEKMYGRVTSPKMSTRVSASRVVISERCSAVAKPSRMVVRMTGMVVAFLSSQWIAVRCALPSSDPRPPER